jgi:hypothetical protein
MPSRCTFHPSENVYGYLYSRSSKDSKALEIKNEWVDIRYISNSTLREVQKYVEIPG